MYSYPRFQTLWVLIYILILLAHRIIEVSNCHNYMAVLFIMDPTLYSGLRTPTRPPQQTLRYSLISATHSACGTIVLPIIGLDNAAITVLWLFYAWAPGLVFWHFLYIKESFIGQACISVMSVTLSYFFQGTPNTNCRVFPFLYP